MWRSSISESSANDEDASGDPVLIGRVVKPHGIRGELVVELLSDVPDRFAPGTPILLGGESTVIDAIRPHKGRLLVTVAGVEDRTAAEEHRDDEIRAAPLDPEELDVYLASELVGLPVVHEDGSPIGTVVDIVEVSPAAGYELLEVEREGADPVLVPSVDELVAIDDSGSGDMVLVVIDPPEGLLD